MRRRVPAAGVNLFQSIYRLLDDYRARSGREPLDLSLGNPDGVPPPGIRRLKARFAQSPRREYHTYAEDKNLLGFAQAMVKLHSGVSASDYPLLKAVPIAGIKTATALIPLACGAHAARKEGRVFRFASNLPSYDVIGAWGEGYLGCDRAVWPLLSNNGMRPNLSDLKTALKKSGRPSLDLIFLIRPGNPASVSASRAEWLEIISYCVKNRIRLVNDAAYCGLSGANHVPLARVAKDFPDLEWMELYSASKSFSDPGARLGALVGSKGFVEDYLVIKGNSDSGPAPAIMAAYGRFLERGTAAQDALLKLRGLYRRRVDYLRERLSAAGLKPACIPDAGFFTLWKVPRRALGQGVIESARKNKTGPAEAFNRIVIAKTGIAGVHFDAPPNSADSEPFIRYAACADVLSSAFRIPFERALSEIKPAY